MKYKYRVIVVFDIWLVDAKLDFKRVANKARRKRQAIPDAGRQDVVLGGRFDHHPAAGEISAAVTMAHEFALTCGRRAELRHHYVLDEEQWLRLVCGKSDEIDAAVESASEQGFAQAVSAAQFSTREAVDRAMLAAIGTTGGTAPKTVARKRTRIEYTKYVRDGDRTLQIQIYGTRHSPPRHPDLRYPYIRLYQDDWDDFGSRSRFTAELLIGDGRILDLGGVKIALEKKGYRASKLPKVLDGLPSGASSLGESIAYYRRIGTGVQKDIREAYLRTMNDCVAEPGRKDVLEGTKVWDDSFMRENSTRHALARGGVYIDAPCEKIVPPRFGFSMRLPPAVVPHEVQIDFSERQGIPNRKMLFIGRNGTGKTRTLATLAAHLVPTEVFVPKTIAEAADVAISIAPAISRVIAISYNAFDEFPLPRTKGEPAAKGVGYRSKMSYKYCGLRTEKGIVNLAEITAMLDAALEPVATSDREEVLVRVLGTLLGGSIAAALCGTAKEREEAVPRLSAGQRLVAAIFCNIIGFIEEGSLLLIDEPETHLHPGLLTSVAAAFDDVLKEFDSYAIMATHSPILLQQVPSHFVRVFTRTNDTARIDPLSFESFGEDIGELSRNVLGLEDPERDFTDVLRDLYKTRGSAQAVEALFDHPLGIPAKAFLYALEDGSLEPIADKAA